MVEILPFPPFLGALRRYLFFSRYCTQKRDDHTNLSKHTARNTSHPHRNMPLKQEWARGVLRMLKQRSGNRYFDFCLESNYLENIVRDQGPTGWLRPMAGSESAAKHCVFVGSEGLTLVYAGGMEGSKKAGSSQSRLSKADTLPQTVVADSPIPSDLDDFYFEVTIERGCPSILVGLCPERNVSSTRRLHGWIKDSLVFSADGQKGKYLARAKKAEEGWRVHDLVDVKDSVTKWESAVVIEEEGNNLLIHYTDWDSRYDGMLNLACVFKCIHSHTVLLFVDFRMGRQELEPHRNISSVHIW